jgi:hypothetical protein
MATSTISEQLEEHRFDYSARREKNSCCPPLPYAEMSLVRIVLFTGISPPQREKKVMRNPSLEGG